MFANHANCVQSIQRTTSGRAKYASVGEVFPTNTWFGSFRNQRWTAAGPMKRSTVLISIWADDEIQDMLESRNFANSRNVCCYILGRGRPHL